jgi:nitrite reductase/ring-hydroxylating ferredoxin subunit
MRIIGRVSRKRVEEEGLVRLPHPPFDVAVAMIDGQPYAIEDACNHAGSSLSEGFVDGDCVACPMHGYVFSIRTGALLRPRGLCDDQRKFEAWLEGDDVVIGDPFELIIR